MNISTFLLLYAVSVPIFFLIDMLWLGLVARNFYQAKLGHLLGDVNWLAAVTFYLLFLLGLTYFATYPAYLASSIATALALGAAFGFFTYMTYDLTNLATLKDWPFEIVVVDILWGTTLGASVAAVTTFIIRLI